MIRAALMVIFALWLCGPSLAADPVRIGSKKFTEGVILGEIATQALAGHGIKAIHVAELGGSRILFDALKAGDIDAYPEYSGTLRRELLGGVADSAVDEALAKLGLKRLPPLGFENTYSIAVTQATADRYSLKTIADLAGVADLRYGITNEFLNRKDGWPGLRAAYGLLADQVRGLDHDLAYRALIKGGIEVMDVYTTDAQIAAYALVLLDDTKSYFEDYDAFYIVRDDMAAASQEALRQLSGTINASEMAALNAAVTLDGISETRAARDALLATGLPAPEAPLAETGLIARVFSTTVDHLRLVLTSLGLAVLIAVPLGILAAKSARLGPALLTLTGLLQTIPSLALFVFLIPLLGIGTLPTIAALFIYSLLPIVRNTHAGLTEMSPSLQESASALGLPAWPKLLKIELPLAMPTILAGIKTAAVINVGLATLGAIIGAGGYGQPILTGIRLNDTSLILEGALPAALMALAVQFGLDKAEDWLRTH